MVRTVLLATLTLVLTAGCASGPGADAAASANAAPGTTTVAAKQRVKTYDKSDAGEDKLHCVRFQPTGSHRIITRCVSQEQRQLEEDAARNALIRATGPVLQAPADL